MTDYKALYEKQLAENKKLKEQVKQLQMEDDTLEDTLSSLNFYQECNEELKEEIKKLKFIKDSVVDEQ
jgi:hypothetical protein